MARRFGRRLSALVLAVILCVSAALTGCGQSRDEDAVSYLVYYLNKDATTIMPLEYTPQAKSAGNVVAELLEQLATQTERVDHIPPISPFHVISHRLSDGLLTIDFSSEYREMDMVKEILVRGAIVNTLCQVNGVKNVTFLVEGEPLADADGNPVGNMTEDMFIYNVGREINTYEKVRLHLYFANEEGTALVDTYRTVVYNSNISMEKLVVEELLKGPNTALVYPTLNPQAKILSVTSKDGVCYVSFDSAFLTEPYNVTPEVAIYSLVNSLTALSGINKVQISIDGDTTQSFLETMNFQTVYERNLSLVESTE
ncbi:MAG: GerMN domain-containing protein [Eubacteriales bacterium]|nr:GerMN domain-containing protein [Eubacteriales bacterium]